MEPTDKHIPNTTHTPSRAPHSTPPDEPHPAMPEASEQMETSSGVSSDIARHARTDRGKQHRRLHEGRSWLKDRCCDRARENLELSHVRPEHRFAAKVQTTNLGTQPPHANCVFHFIPCEAPKKCARLNHKAKVRTSLNKPIGFEEWLVSHIFHSRPTAPQRATPLGTAMISKGNRSKPH